MFLHHPEYPFLLEAPENQKSQLHLLALEGRYLPLHLLLQRLQLDQLPQVVLYLSSFSCVSVPSPLLSVPQSVEPPHLAEPWLQLR